MAENYFEDTIAAISTPAGSGGIGIIRISGPEAFPVCKKIFRAYLSVTKKMASRERSADVFEAISLAKTWFFGKISDRRDIGRVFDQQNASSEYLYQRRRGGNQLSRRPGGDARYSAGTVRTGNTAGGTGRIYKKSVFKWPFRPFGSRSSHGFDPSPDGHIQKSGCFTVGRQIIRGVGRHTAIGEIEVTLEYPEYEMEAEAAAHTEIVLGEIIDQLKDLAVSYGRGRLLREGLRVVIAGKPNAGKSSLLNYLSGHSRAIVTEIPGTTRDTIEEFTEIDGYPVWITDTAGLRSSDDPVERIGIEKARAEIQNADLVLYMADPGENHLIDRETEAILPENTVVLLNKTDIAEKGQLQRVRERFSKYRTIEISVLQKKGIEKVIDLIKKRFDCYDGNGAILTNARHKQLIDESIEALKRGLDQYRLGMPLDCVTYDIRQCAEKLGEITGTSVSDEVIDNIFKRFCLGK